MKTNNNIEYYALIQKAIKGFLDYHKIPNTELKIQVYDGVKGSIITNRPGKFHDITKLKPNDEYDGVQVIFMTGDTPDDIPVKYWPKFRELMSRLMFHAFPEEYLKDYNQGEDNSFEQDLTETTCWHHCSLTWAQFSDGYQIKIQVGYCQCS